MNILVDDHITQRADFTKQFMLFPPPFGVASPTHKPASRLSSDQLNSFLGTERDDARSAHFCVPAAEPPAPTPEKGLAAGVLKQAAHDLRRFRAATKGLKRELYLDAYSWITENDFSWPYSFVNVCKLLHVSPDVVRAEILADASLGWLDYWTQRAGRISRKVTASFARVFANGGRQEISEASQLASTI